MLFAGSQPAAASVAQQAAAPTVTINQGAGQLDPAFSRPIIFDVVFSGPVTGFGVEDIVLSGTAGATSVSVSGADASYTVAVSGMNASGTVIASIPAGAAQDSEGNLSSASTSTDATVTFLLDTVAPETKITGVPANPQVFSDQFSFAGIDDLIPTALLAYECTLDDSEWFSCASPYDLTDLTLGFHTFQVRAIDLAGNADPSPATHTWEVRPSCVFDTATIYVDRFSVIRGGPDNGKPYAGVLNGTNSKNVIVGTSNAETINAAGGSDIVCAMAGGDTVYGGNGDDTIYGLDGADTLYGESGNDKLYGGMLADKVYGGAGSDTLDGNLGNDELYGGNNNDTIIGGPVDIPEDAFDDDLIMGEAGNDTLTGGARADRFDGGSGSDSITDFSTEQGDTQTSVP